MPVTRDSNYSPERAQLMQSFNHCADGYSMDDVLEAAGNLVIAGIGNHAKLHGWTKDATIQYARSVCSAIIGGVENNWQRKSLPSDIEVKPQ